jgi:hypothetical protein
MLLTLESEDLNITSDAGNATVDTLITIIDECLSEALKIFQLSPSQDTERDKTEESSICNIGNNFTHDQPIESGLSLGDTFFNHTLLDSTPRSFGNDRNYILGAEPVQITQNNDGIASIYGIIPTDLSYDWGPIFNETVGNEGGENETTLLTNASLSS